MPLSTDLSKAILEIKATINHCFNTYLKYKQEEKEKGEFSEKIRDELAKLTFLLGIIAGTGFFKKESAENIQLIKIGQLVINGYTIILSLIVIILFWILFYWIVVKMNRNSKIYKFFIKINNYPLPILFFGVILTFIIVNIISPSEPYIINKEIAIVLLIILIMISIVSYFIGRDRKPLEPKILLNIQPSMLSITEDGTELHANLTNKTNKNIKDLHIEFSFPKCLKGRINDVEYNKRFELKKQKLNSNSILPINIKILSVDEGFKGKNSIIKVKMESNSQLIKEEIEVPVIS